MACGKIKEESVMKKDVREAFGKEVYLLGSDKNGINYWLEEPKWDCGWYWGCGYVETYTNNKNPEKARDVESHQHFDGLFLNGKQNGYDTYKTFFKEMTVNDKELWTLIEVMKTIYILKETAEVIGRGGSHYTTNPCKDIIINQEEVKRINEIVLPALFNEVKKILTNE